MPKNKNVFNSAYIAGYVEQTFKHYKRKVLLNLKWYEYVISEIIFETVKVQL